MTLFVNFTYIVVTCWYQFICFTIVLDFFWTVINYCIVIFINWLIFFISDIIFNCVTVSVFIVNENVTLTPDLVGRDYDAEVRNNRSYIDEYLFYVTLEYSDTVEKGRIIRQSPEAGEVIQKGDTVSLVVSRGPQMMEMPDIIGQTQDSAVQELATKGLNATCFTVVNDGSEAAGCVVSASEDAGSMVEVGTTIVLYIAGDVPADAPAGPEAPSDTGTPAGGDAAQGGVEYDTD